MARVLFIFANLLFWDPATATDALLVVAAALGAFAAAEMAWGAIERRLDTRAK